MPRQSTAEGGRPGVPTLGQQPPTVVQYRTDIRPQRLPPNHIERRRLVAAAASPAAAARLKI
jgi:hypothetical protein